MAALSSHLLPSPGLGSLPLGLCLLLLLGLPLLPGLGLWPRLGAGQWWNRCEGERAQNQSCRGWGGNRSEPKAVGRGCGWGPRPGMGEETEGVAEAAGARVGAAGAGLPCWGGQWGWAHGGGEGEQL